MSTPIYTAISTQLSLPQAMQQAAQLEASGQMPAAEAIYRQILAAAPQFHPAYHALGLMAHQFGNLPLAAELVAKAVAIDGNSGMYQRNLGEMYRRLEKLDLAIAHGQRAVMLEPNDAAAHSNLGIAFYDQKNWDAAEACQTRAIALEPNMPAALNNLGSIQRERKNNTEAIAFYRRAIAADAKYTEPLNNLGALLVLESEYEEAREVLKQALQLAPSYSDAHCNLGFALNGLDEHVEAFSHFQTAIQLRPSYAEAYLGIAKVHQERHDLAAAEKAARHGVLLRAEKPDAHNVLGEILMEASQTQQAMECFDHALALDPTLTTALLGKGNLLMEMGDMVAAEALMLQALEGSSNKQQIAARFSLIQVKKVQAGDANMAALLAAYEAGNLSKSDLQYTHFALGKCYDDTKQYDLAMPHFIAACALKRKTLDYDAAFQAQTFDNTIATFSAENIERWRGASNDSNVPIFVLGMPRSGTTLTEQIVASHPDVFGAGELHELLQMVNRDGSFPENMADISHAQISAWGAEYVASLRKYSADARHITDKMPSNFFAVGLIHTMLPNAKIVHVRRNPVDTCLSCFTRLFNRGQESTYDFAELGQYYTGYARLMQHWREVLPANAWLEVQYEDIVTDMEGQARRLIDFCGLEWNTACLDFHKTERSIRTASVTQVRQPIYTSSVARWRKYEAHLTPLLDALGSLA